MSWSTIFAQIGSIFTFLGLLVLAYYHIMTIRSLLGCIRGLRQSVKLLGDAQAALERRVRVLEGPFGCPPIEILPNGQQVFVDDPPGDAPWG